MYRCYAIGHKGVKFFVFVGNVTRDDVLSVQKIDLLIGVSISFRTMLSNRVATTAADNSRRGIVSCFSGDNLHLLLTKEHWMSPSALATRIGNGSISTLGRIRKMVKLTGNYFSKIVRLETAIDFQVF